VADLMDLDRWALSRYNALVKAVRAGYDSYEFHAVYRAIYNFCVVDLSNVYFDIIKDRLYCDDDAKRASAQTALYLILDGLTRMIAPILAFTSEEIWRAMPHHAAADAECVLFNDIPDYDPALALDDAAAERWNAIIALRDDVNKALEAARSEQGIGKSLEAAVTVNLLDDAAKAAFASEDAAALADLFIVSQFAFGDADEGLAGENFPNLKVVVAPAAGDKCPRCWKHTTTPNANGLCPRCAAVLGE